MLGSLELNINAEREVISTAKENNVHLDFGTLPATHVV